MTPVMMPGSACGSTMVRIACQRVPPRLTLTVRNSVGTARSASSAVLMITGSVMMASVSAAGQDRGAEPQEQHEQPQPEQTVDHRGDAGQVDDRQPDGAGQPVVARILGQVDRSCHADRDCRQGGAEGQQKRADDGREDAARLHPVARHGRQELPADGADAPDDDRADHEEDRHDHEQRPRPSRMKPKRCTRKRLRTA